MSYDLCWNDEFNLADSIATEISSALKNGLTVSQEELDVLRSKVLDKPDLMLDAIVRKYVECTIFSNPADEEFIKKLSKTQIFNNFIDRHFHSKS